jgi:hypothetical protein
MRVTSSTFTVAEYCQQMTDKSITVNKQYQRSNQIWPAAARSFLIDSMLAGFPMPKLSLYQKTDLRTRRTIKEIVDGQQRSQAILDFFNDTLRISTKGLFQGMTFSRLEPEQQQQFLDYAVSVDVFVDATESDIRELFRRVNSYNVPLNYQEKRHATYQGNFKWFIYQESNRYSQLLKDLGTFSEPQIARMDDAKFLADFCVALRNGVISASEAKIDALYREFDPGFAEEPAYAARFEEGFNTVLQFRDALTPELTKKYQLYIVLLAFCHKIRPVDSLNALAVSDGRGIQDIEITTFDLSALAEALSTGQTEREEFRTYLANSAKTTDRLIQRQERFKILFSLLK